LTYCLVVSNSHKKIIAKVTRNQFDNCLKIKKVRKSGKNLKKTNRKQADNCVLVLLIGKSLLSPKFATTVLSAATTD